jgi:hypothetical protein
MALLCIHLQLEQLYTFKIRILLVVRLRQIMQQICKIINSQVAFHLCMEERFIYKMLYCSKVSTIISITATRQAVGVFFI